MVDKAPDAYRTISEVADDLDLPQHVLRFWETRFAQIRPLKRGGGRRYYRPEDIDLLKGIRHLLYGEGYTIRGVQRIIKESGVKSIQAIGRGEGAAGLPKPGGPEILDPAGDEPETGGLRASLRGLFRSAPEPVRSSPSLAVEADAVAPSFHEDSYGQRPFAARREEPYLAPNAPRAARPDEVAERDDLSEPAREWHPAPAASVARATIAPAPVAPPAPPAPAPMVAAPPHRPVVTPYAPPPVPAPPQASATARLSAEDIRRLQSALYELGECRKRLDQAFEPR